MPTSEAPDGRSFSIDNEAALCIIDRLPAGGADRVLPIFDPLDQMLLPRDDCQVQFGPDLPVQNGRFRNNLLGQTIALSLNVRINPDLDPGDPDGPRGPGAFVLSERFCTAPPSERLVHAPEDIALSVPMPDGRMLDIVVTKANVEFAVAGDDSETFWIDTAVIEALDELFGSHTVNDLLALANHALAGLDTGGATLGQIKDAVDAINNAFDECRMVVPCPPGLPGEATLR